MKSKDEYITKLSSELKVCSSKIDSLIAKAEIASENLKIECVQDFNALRIKEQVAIDKIKELEEASTERWIELKETADEIWDDLRIDLAIAISKFK